MILIASCIISLGLNFQDCELGFISGTILA